jgi:hypothetical protein
MEQKLRDLLAKYNASDFCGCYEGDMTEEFPHAKERLVQDILELLREIKNEYLFSTNEWLNAVEEGDIFDVTSAQQYIEDTLEHEEECGC